MGLRCGSGGFISWRTASKTTLKCLSYLFSKVIAEAIHSEPAMRLDWIRDELKMGARAYCSQLIGHHKSRMENTLELRAKKGELLKNDKTTD